MQEITRKCPEGYREATPEESARIKAASSSVMMHVFQCRQREAELSEAMAKVTSAKLLLKEANQLRQIEYEKLIQLSKEMGWDEKPGSLLEEGQRCFVLVDQSKRITELPPIIPKVVPPKAEEIRKGVTYEVKDENGKVIQSGEAKSEPPTEG